MRNIVTVILLIMGIITVRAGKYEDAEKAFASGNYAEAAGLFEDMLNRGENSASIYYDLGTCYAAEGNMGLARLNLERAYRQEPGSKEIKGNLEYVVNKIDDANRASMTGKRGSVEPDAKGFVGEIHDTITTSYTSNYWATLGAISFILTLGSVALYLFPSNVAARKVGFFGGLTFLSFTVLFLVFSVMGAQAARSHEYGVITAYKYELHEEPEMKSRPSASPLTQGTKVRIISEESDIDGNVSWYKVRLNSGYIGWIEAKDMEVI